MCLQHHIIYIFFSLFIGFSWTWFAIYKDGEAWNSRRFIIFSKYYTLSNEDIEELKSIVNIDKRAIYQWFM